MEGIKNIFLQQNEKTVFKKSIYWIQSGKTSGFLPLKLIHYTTE